MGLALTGHSTAGLARQGANPDAWQHPPRALARCAAHRRASPSTLCQAGSKRDHRQDASRDCPTRNKVRRFILLVARFAFDVLAGHGANGMATSMHPAIAERGTKIAECEAKSVGPK
jgi:hypothetical protein